MIVGLLLAGCAAAVARNPVPAAFESHEGKVNLWSCRLERA